MLGCVLLGWLDLRLSPRLKVDGATGEVLRGLEKELFVVLDSFPRESFLEFFEIVRDQCCEVQSPFVHAVESARSKDDCKGENNVMR